MEHPCKVNPELAGELPCGCRCLLAAFFPQRLRSVPLPTGDVPKDVGHGGRNGRSSEAWAVPQQSKLALRLVGLKSGARCSWSCSPLGCRAASFQILYFCEKPGEGNAFISASSDAACTGAAQTCLEPRPLRTLLYPSVSPLVALSCVSNGNSRVMTELQDSRLCACARADHNYPSPPP